LVKGKAPAVFSLPKKATLWYRDAGMTLDQKIQIWVAVGTWLAGLATLAAVIVALRLAKRIEKVRLKVHAGLRVLIMGDGSPFQKHLAISVTNLGERALASMLNR
jgi:hypothetical protein